MESIRLERLTKAALSISSVYILHLAITLNIDRGQIETKKNER